MSNKFNLMTKMSATTPEILYYPCGNCNLESYGPYKCRTCDIYYCSQTCWRSGKLHKCKKTITISNVKSVVDKWFNSLLGSSGLNNLLSQVPQNYSLYNMFDNLEQITNCGELVLTDNESLADVIVSKLKGSIPEIEELFDPDYIPLVLNIYIDGKDFMVARRLPRIKE